VTGECRIGSLPWFAGMWWFSLTLLAFGGVHVLRRLRSALDRAVVGLATAADRFADQAIRCAEEGSE
jgi:hypothetical protein